MAKNYEKDSEIARFYSNKSVLITGGSGFIGQVLIEKLLYSCLDINKIYVFIRPKKNMTSAQRIKMITESVVFSRLKLEKPEVLKKIEGVEGELSLPNLGLSVECQKILLEDVSVVFHLAATIRFNEPLTTAVTINVDGTLQLLNLSKKFKRIEAFVYVSTAYSNIDKSYIEEKVYPPSSTLDEVHKFIERNASEDKVEVLLAGRHNTYFFTKGIAEHEVAMNKGNVPVAIIRPSIVSPIYKEPIQGWLMSWNGASALLYYAAEGIFRFQKGNGDLVADFIPVDLVTNMTIVAAANCKKSNDLNVYNCCSGPRNPITWNQTIDGFIRIALAKDKLPFPSFTFFKTQMAVNIFTFLLLTLPCFLIDCFRRILGHEPKYTKIAKQLRKVEAKLNFGTSSQWDFGDDNMRALLDSMTPEDRNTYYCDPSDIDWGTVVVSYYLGVRRYLMHLDD